MSIRKEASDRSAHQRRAQTGHRFPRHQEDLPGARKDTMECQLSSGGNGRIPKDMP
jgi:hypothetical protein